MYQKKEFVVDTLNRKVEQVCSVIKVWQKQNYHLNLGNNKVVVDLKLQSIEKYWRCIAQVTDKFTNLYDFLLALTMFIYKAYTTYNQKM